MSTFWNIYICILCKVNAIKRFSVFLPASPLPACLPQLTLGKAFSPPFPKSTRFVPTWTDLESPGRPFQNFTVIKSVDPRFWSAYSMSIERLLGSEIVIRCVGWVLAAPLIRVEVELRTNIRCISFANQKKEILVFQILMQRRTLQIKV